MSVAINSETEFKKCRENAGIHITGKKRSVFCKDIADVISHYIYVSNGVFRTLSDI